LFGGFCEFCVVRRSFRPERDHRIDARRPSRGDERRDEGHDRDERGDGVAGRRIARAPTPKSVF